MPIKLSDTQIAMLRVAAQRDDRCLVLPPKLKGGAAQKVAAKMIEAILVREIKAKHELPVWRRDAEAGQAFALKLTAAGLKAVADRADTKAAPKDQQPSSPESKQKEKIMDETIPPSRRANDSAPRNGSKLAMVIGLLQRGGGATIVDLTDATGWLSHTTRAALTGLRKRGYAVTRERPEDGPSAYLIVEAGKEAADAKASANESKAWSGKSRSESKVRRAA